MTVKRSHSTGLFLNEKAGRIQGPALLVETDLFDI